MSSKWTFKSTKDIFDLREYDGSLPIDQPVAIYYRQSTTMQVGNISTTMQTVDMKAELKRKGWNEDDIILIDMDEGVSGTKRIDERQGMAELFELITRGKIRAVACQDEDRLFRDVTQIQVNIFIEACKKSHVQVITPFITYDFAHPLHGDYHARQFRFKCEMAAEYLKSYIQGRLVPARQRLMREGKWAGTKMPVGFMADVRKNLPDGSENPNYRKFAPFEPYAAIVREYYRMFLECGGNAVETLRRIHNEKISFPECSPPEGFKTNYQLRWRKDGYYLNRGNLINMLVNPVYIGHWHHCGAVVIWNNHPPIIDMDTYMRVFNYLSPHSLTGEKNEDYLRRNFPKGSKETVTDERSNAYQPLLLGLLSSNHNSRRVNAQRLWDKRNKAYSYVVYVSGEMGELFALWARRCSWVDDAIVYRFKQRLEGTFQSAVWTEAIDEANALSDRSISRKQSQLEALAAAMESVITNLTNLTHPDLIREMEKKYAAMEDERNRLLADIATEQMKGSQRLTVEEANQLFYKAMNCWEVMSYGDRQDILSMFIDCIEATDFDRDGTISLTITWRDGNQDKISLWRKPNLGEEFWNLANVEKLLSLVDNKANQLEIAAEFPDRKWCQIFNEIAKHRGLVRFSHVWIGKQETFDEYVLTGGRKGRASGTFWRPEELATLKQMAESGASQIELMQAFPYRRWIWLRRKVTELCGMELKVPFSGIDRQMSYDEYVQSIENGATDPSSGTAIWNFGWLILPALGFL